MVEFDVKNRFRSNFQAAKQSFTYNHIHNTGLGWDKEAAMLSDDVMEPTWVNCPNSGILGLKVPHRTKNKQSKEMTDEADDDILAKWRRLRHQLDSVFLRERVHMTWRSPRTGAQLRLKENFQLIVCLKPKILSENNLECQHL